MSLLLGICKNCGKKSEYYPSQTTGNFCSSTCWHEYAKGENHPSYKGRRPSNCKQCGKEVIDVKHPNRKFCSMTCYSEWMKTNTPVLKPNIRKKLSDAKKGGTPWNKGKNGIFSEETLRKLSEVSKNRIVSEETKEKRSKSIKEKWKDPTYREKQIPSKIGSRNPFFGKKLSREHIKKMRSGLTKRPTKPEKMLIGVMKDHDLPFKYVGSGDLMVGALFPDFIHTGKKKKIIELFGRAFHDPEKTFKKQMPYHQTYDGRMDYYKQHGYGCLIFWDDEIKNEKEVVEKINVFAGGVICA